MFDQIQDIQNQGARSVTYNLLPLESAELDTRYNDLGIRNGILLRLDRTIVEALYKGNNDFIRVPIQVSEKSTLFLLIKKYEI